MRTPFLILLGWMAVASATARAEYNFQEPKPPPDGSPDRTFLSLPAGNGGAEPNPAAVSGEFTDFRPTPKRSPEQLAATLQEAERLRALNNLERAKALDDELIRVRQMLSDKVRSDRQEAEALARGPVAGSAAPAPVAPAPTAAPGMPSVETASTSRLLAAVQDDESSRRSERARLQLLRESLVRKQRRDPAFTRAAGGSKFHAAIEFNEALRGSSAPGTADGGFRDRLAEAPERPTNRQLFPVETSDSLLLMHKFRSVDLSIDGKAAQVPDDRRYQLKGGDPYDSSIKDALPSSSSHPSSGGGLIRP